MSRIQRALLVQFGSLLLLVVGIGVAVRLFPIADYIVHAQQRLGAMQIWGAVLYPVFYGACNVLLLPAGVVAMGSGLFFGLWWGFLLNLSGTVFGAGVSFLLSRQLGRHWLERRILQQGKWATLDRSIARDGWKIVLLTHINPLSPTSLLNYVYGVTRIRFGTCLLCVAVAQAPGQFLYAYLGTLMQFGMRLMQGESTARPLDYVLWSGGLLVTLVTTAMLARFAIRWLTEIESASASPATAPDAIPLASTSSRES